MITDLKAAFITEIHACVLCFCYPALGSRHRPDLVPSTPSLFEAASLATTISSSSVYVDEHCPHDRTALYSNRWEVARSNYQSSCYHTSIPARRVSLNWKHAVPSTQDVTVTCPVSKRKTTCLIIYCGKKHVWGKKPPYFSPQLIIMSYRNYILGSREEDWSFIIFLLIISYEWIF